MTFAGKLLTCCAAGAMLAACGGNDKKAGPSGRDVAYTGSTTPIVLAQGNVATMASLASGSVTGSVGSASSGPGYAATVSADRRMTYETALARIRAARRDFAVAFAGVTNACPGGGSYTATASAASSTVTTSGDWFELSYANCNDGTGSVANGTLRIDIVATDGADPSMGPTAMTSGFTYRMTLTVTDFSIEDPTGWFGMEGDVHMSQVWNAATFRLESAIQGSSLVTASGVGSTVTTASAILPLNLSSTYSMSAAEEYTDATAMTLYADESALNATICSIEMNGCIQIETPAAIRQLATQLYPMSGTLKVSDLLGHYIQIEPTNGATGAVTVSWEVVLGAPTPDKTCYTYWTTMSTDTCFQ